MKIIIIIIIVIIIIIIKHTITLEKMGVNDVIDQEFTASLKKKASSLFRQISTSALPTLTAVTLMRCVIILLDLTHAHVKQDSQEMDSHALVSRLSIFCLFDMFVS